MFWKEKGTCKASIFVAFILDFEFSHLCMSSLYCRSVRYIPFPPGRHDLPLYARMAGKPLVMARTTYDGIVTVDVAGRVRLWETGITNLVRSLEKWKGLIGEDYQGPLQVRLFIFISVKWIENNRYYALKYARLFVSRHYLYYSWYQRFFLARRNFAAEEECLFCKLGIERHWIIRSEMDTKLVDGVLWMRVLSHVGKVVVFEKQVAYVSKKCWCSCRLSLEQVVLKLTVCLYVTNSGKLLERKWWRRQQSKTRQGKKDTNAFYRKNVHQKSTIFLPYFRLKCVSFSRFLDLFTAAKWRYSSHFSHCISNPL